MPRIWPRCKIVPYYAWHYKTVPLLNGRTLQIGTVFIRYCYNSSMPRTFSTQPQWRGGLYPTQLLRAHLTLLQLTLSATTKVTCSKTGFLRAHERPKTLLRLPGIDAKSHPTDHKAYLHVQNGMFLWNNDINNSTMPKSRGRSSLSKFVRNICHSLKKTGYPGYKQYKKRDIMWQTYTIKNAM